MYLTGGIPPQPMVYRCTVDEEWRICLPVEVRQALNVRPEHRVDLTVKGNKVEMAHAWPCCQLCGGSEGLRRFRGSRIWTACRPCRRTRACGRARGAGKKITKQVFFL